MAWWSPPFWRFHNRRRREGRSTRGRGRWRIGPAGRRQVWSLTQFYSVDLSQWRICVNKCAFYKRTIKVCISCCWRCAGTSAPSVAPWCQCPYFSVGPKAMHEASWGPEKGTVSAQKALQGSETETRDLQGKLQTTMFPDEESLICPSGKSMIFLKKETVKN